MWLFHGAESLAYFYLRTLLDVPFESTLSIASISFIETWSNALRRLEYKYDGATELKATHFFTTL
jgi:hypothetical protein